MATTVSQHTGVGTNQAVSQKGLAAGYIAIDQKGNGTATAVSGHSGVTGFTEIAQK